jgi:hypothetical protein
MLITPSRKELLAAELSSFFNNSIQTLVIFFIKTNENLSC